MFAEARRTEIGDWEVFCTNCKMSIGTMSGKTFNLAMMFALTRGGVKCPKCRKNSCPGCGLQTAEGALCTLCDLFVTTKNNPVNLRGVWG